MTSYKTIQTSLEDGILTITLNRPNMKNAMNMQMWLELDQVLIESASDDNVVFVVITGAGTFYCSGFDIKDRPSSDEMDMDEFLKYRIKLGKKFIATLIDFPKLLIGIVNGPSVGVATTTLGLFDFVFCTANATFWTPFTALGLSAEGCSSYIFPKIMGTSMANNMLQFGQKIDANQAKNCGLISEVYKPEQIETVLWPKIKSMKETLSKESILANKKLIRGWDRKILHEVNEAEWKELESRFVSEDFLNSVLKFMNRSKSENKL